LKERLIELIENEDKKNPYTDGQIAKILGLSRGQVTTLRMEIDIPNSRERLKSVLVKEINDILSKNGNMSDRKLTAILKGRGFDISRYSVAQIRKELGIVTENCSTGYMSTYDCVSKENVNAKRPVEGVCSEAKIAGEETFEELIGYNGSLKLQIQQAKAAVLYPPHGLHTLIIGPTGTGKSMLAEAMYRFAIKCGKLSESAPFVVFNCADYAENPQLLISQLFGHVKGAFTGAHTDKEGLVEKANGGILFLDEVHRLPSEGQELLYYLLDKGKFRRLGETGSTRKASVMIIAATTEDIQSSLLLTFRRRIPMVIELPLLSSRPLIERYMIINNFFNKEATKIGVSIEISGEALRLLLLYDCPGNIGQLQSDIQVICARGFLAYMSIPHRNNKTIKIDLDDLPPHIRQGILNVQKRLPEIEEMVESHLLINPGEDKEEIFDYNNPYVLSGEIYRYIEKKYSELRNRGMGESEIKRQIGGQLEIRFKRVMRRFENNFPIMSREELAEIVGQDIIDMVDKMRFIAEKGLNKRMNNHIFACISIHLNAAIDRIRNNKTIINPRLDKIKSDYKREYYIARDMIQILEDNTGIKFPDDEVGFIAMYLRMLTSPEEVAVGKVGVVVITHGHVAKGMAEVANRLLGVNHAIGIEMSLDEKPESALLRATEAVKIANEGKGVILLVDMGSLVTFGEIITQRTGIPTRTISRVDTVMVLETVRRAILPDAEIDDIVEDIGGDMVGISRLMPVNSQVVKDSAIITICITGEGTAMRIKNLLMKMIPGINDRVDIIPLGVLDSEDINLAIDRIKAEKDVIAIVGTLNPGRKDIPFISIEDVINGKAASKLGSILDIDLKVLPESFIKLSPLSSVIYPELIRIHPEYHSKDEVLQDLVQLLIDNGFVNEKFLLDVYRREIIVPTLIENGIAIPHGTPENVYKSGVAIAILKEPIKWMEKNVVDIVFMFAVKEDDREIPAYLYRFIKNKEFVRYLKQLKTPEYVKNAFIDLN